MIEIMAIATKMSFTENSGIYLSDRNYVCTFAM